MSEAKYVRIGEWCKDGCEDWWSLCGGVGFLIYRFRRYEEVYSEMKRLDGKATAAPSVSSVASCATDSMEHHRVNASMSVLAHIAEHVSLRRSLQGYRSRRRRTGSYE